MKIPRPDKNLRVIVIDDNQSIHKDFRKILAGRGGSGDVETMEKELFGKPADKPTFAAFHVDSAYQGEEGLELVRRALQEGRPYSVAFIDVRMPPGWDGIETTARIWAVDPDVQVVVCTAYSDFSWSEMVDRLGYSDRLLILKKPFDNIEALQLATALSEKWNLTQQARFQIADLEEFVDERTAALTQANSVLTQALANVKDLSGLVPICGRCKKIRDDRDYWHTVEQYLTQHTNARFTHGLCPTCLEKEMREVEQMSMASSLPGPDAVHGQPTDPKTPFKIGGDHL